MRVASVALFALLVACNVRMSAESLVVVHDRYTDGFSRVEDEMCSFPVLIEGSSNINDALFFDANGKLVRVLSTVNHSEITFTANGVTLRAIGTGGIEYILNPDGSVLVHTFGINLRLTLPGQGAVILDAGRATYLFDPHIHELFHAGPVRYEDDGRVCGALAGA